jgi:hypothetical protein
MMFPKTPIRRSEAYRRAVAALPCIACGVHGYSQAAHGSEGKGMGLKAGDDQLFPLCADRPGVRGCHSAFDQGGMFTKLDRRSVEKRWKAETQRRLNAR